VTFKNHHLSAFSLVEVTLALGVAGFCLIAVLGLLPTAVRTNQTSTSQTDATTIISAVAADLRATAKTTTAATQSQQFRLNIPASNASNTAAQVLYFDDQGACSTDIAGSIKPGGGAWVPAIQVRYRLSVKFPSNGGSSYSPTYSVLRVSWPAVVDPYATPPPLPAGSAELFAAFSRY
jgi:type II secretory pathway pseudopilin PulG